MIKYIFTWIIILCRIAVGLVVTKTGFDFARGSGAFAYWENDGITGIFVMIIGVYIVFSSLFRGLFDQENGESENNALNKL